MLKSARIAFCKTLMLMNNENRSFISLRFELKFVISLDFFLGKFEMPLLLCTRQQLIGNIKIRRGLLGFL